MPISEKVKENMSRASWIRRMFEEGIALKKQFGEKEVLDFSLGNPVEEPPEAFFDELRRLAQERPRGAHRYMANAGFQETRSAVAAQLAKETGIAFSPEELLMTCGAAGALNVAIKTIADAGDEIIVLAPYFAEYLFYTENFGVKPVIVETDENFEPDPDAIAAAITPRTRGLIVNSPNNPTGKVYSAEFYRALDGLLLQKEKETGRPIYVLADDPYSKLVYDGEKAPRALSLVKNCIGISSHSKDLSLPGERIGYLAVSPRCADAKELINGAAFCNRTLGFVNAPALIQRLVAPLQSCPAAVSRYQAKRDLLYNALREIGYKMIKPGGAFYFFPQSPIPDDVRFVQLLQERKVLTVPGTGFGRPGHFRIAYCVEEDTVKRSLSRFAEAYDSCT